MHGRLRILLKQLVECAPADRIHLRDPILAYGGACIEPLMDVVADHPGLGSSAAAWLEVLAKRDQSVDRAVRVALRRLAVDDDHGIAQQALDRLAALGHPAGSRPSTPRSGQRQGKRDVVAEIRARLIEAAKAGQILIYSDLETNRGHLRRPLVQIAHEEGEAGRPPLTAIVVTKTTRRPGEGFLPTMHEIGFAHPGEPEEDLWRRAVAAVHAYWRDQQ